MFTVLRFGHSFFRHLFLVICFSAFTYGQSLPVTNHNTSKNDAIKYINNFKVSPAATIIGIKGGAYNRGIIDTVLSQSGCVGIRIYYGKLDNGNYTLVLVGVDTAGNDLSNGTIAQAIMPCPPECGGAASSLIK